MAAVDGGGLADYAIARATSTFPRPEAMDAMTAAAVLVSYGTGDIALTRRARLQPDETVVVFSAGGVLGQATIALARAKGATVIAAARSAEARERAVAAGAQLCLDSGSARLLDAVSPPPAVVVPRSWSTRLVTLASARHCGQRASTAGSSPWDSPGAAFPASPSTCSW